MNYEFRNMKQHILALFTLLLLSVSVPSTVLAQRELIDAAVVQYDSAQYEQTIATYEQIASKYGVSPELYYNLGNAYYKQQNYPKAILNYERCLLYDPSHGDAQQNRRENQEGQGRAHVRNGHEGG